MKDAPLHFLVSCEHGGRRVPARYRPLFRAHRSLLATHRGFDPGALALAHDLAALLAAPLMVSTVSRLVVDLNRSPHHPRLHGEPLRRAPAELRREVVAHYYTPYRERAERQVAEAVAAGARVIHIAAHSFTPVLDGVARTADVGLLYDPARAGEVHLCARWQAALAALAPQLRTRRNYPYRGKSDGLCSWLRRRFDERAYVGIELEVNQKHVFRGGASWQALRDGLTAALQAALEGDDVTGT